MDQKTSFDIGRSDVCRTPIPVKSLMDPAPVTSPEDAQPWMSPGKHGSELPGSNAYFRARLPEVSLNAPPAANLRRVERGLL